MAKHYRTYSSEFKHKLIEEIDTGSITIAEAARQHDISRSLIERWREQIHGGTFRERPSSREKHLERELEKAQAKIGQLTLIIDALKKITKNSASLRESNVCVVTGENLASASKTGAR